MVRQIRRSSLYRDSGRYQLPAVYDFLLSRLSPSGESGPEPHLQLSHVLTLGLMPSRRKLAKRLLIENLNLIVLRKPLPSKLIVWYFPTSIESINFVVTLILATNCMILSDQLYNTFRPLLTLITTTTVIQNLVLSPKIA